MIDIELEKYVVETLNKIKNMSDDKYIIENLSVKELKDVLSRVRDFIDYTKFEFGEDITIA